MNISTCKILRFWEKHKSSHVFVGSLAISRLAEYLKKCPPTVPDWRIPEVLPESDEAFVSHIFYICAVDFAFTHFEPPYEKYQLESGHSGSEALVAAFYRKFGERPISADMILKITDSPVKTEAFFQGLNLPPLMEERRLNLQESASVVKNCFGNNPANLLEHSKYSADRLISLLLTYFYRSFGSDCYSLSPEIMNAANFYENPLFANKRAQLFPLIYQGRALHSQNRLPLLRDEKNIGPVADYQIPKFFRDTGVLRYVPELDDKIANREILSFGSREEMEIRFATIYVINQLQQLTGLTMPALDFFFWSEGQKVKSRHHHLCPTTAY